MALLLQLDGKPVSNPNQQQKQKPQQQQQQQDINQHQLPQEQKQEQEEKERQEDEEKEEQYKQEQQEQQEEQEQQVEVFNIRKALYQLYGGQAVGNGYRFLVIYHLLPFYLFANVIIGCNYQNNLEKWGQLNPDVSSYSFYCDLMNDCDFLTCVPSLRKYLEKEVFMKDLEKTEELLKRVFDHIYLYILLAKKFLGFDQKSLKDEVQGALKNCFTLEFKF
jgi:flagellar biosynthesis GTPase FlhF